MLAYRAIVKYGLYGESADDLPSPVLSLLKMAMPTMDSNMRKYKKRIERIKNTDFEKMCNEHVKLPNKEMPLKEKDNNEWEESFFQE